MYDAIPKSHSYKYSNQCQENMSVQVSVMIVRGGNLKRTNLCIAVLVDDDIVGLDVTVHNASHMQIADGIQLERNAISCDTDERSR